DAEPVALRLLQRLIEMALRKLGSGELAQAMLEEIGGVVRADMASVYEGPPPWKAVWNYTRRGLGKANLNLPTTTMAEVLDRTAGTALPPAVEQPAYVMACLSFRETPNRVLVANRPRESFTQSELEYVVAAGHYLGVALEQAQAWEELRERH